MERGAMYPTDSNNQDEEFISFLKEKEGTKHC